MYMPIRVCVFLSVALSPLIRSLQCMNNVRCSWKYGVGLWSDLNQRAKNIERKGTQVLLV